MTRRGWTWEVWAERVAQTLDGARYVNVGVGIPAKLPQLLAGRVELLFQCENGILGTGPPPPGDATVPELIDASTNPVTLQRGAAIVPLDTSFAIIRGGHLDATILGAFQVSARGDLANWSSPSAPVAGVGGAMDIAIGAKRTCVMMHHRSRDGAPKIVDELTFPPTANECVDVIVTEFAVLKVNGGAIDVVEMADDISEEELQDWTDAPLRFSVSGGTSGPARMGLGDGSPASPARGPRRA